MAQLPPIPSQEEMGKGFTPPPRSARISSATVPQEPDLPKFEAPVAPDPITQGAAVALSALANVPGGQELVGAAINKTMEDYRQRRQLFEADTRRMLEVRWRARQDERLAAQGFNVDIAKANQQASGEDATRAEGARHNFMLEQIAHLEAEANQVLTNAKMNQLSAQEAADRMTVIKTKIDAVRSWGSAVREAAGIARKKGDLTEGGGGESGGTGGGAGATGMGKLGFEVPPESAQGVQITASSQRVSGLDAQKQDLIRQRDEAVKRDPNSPEAGQAQTLLTNIDAQINEEVRNQAKLQSEYFTLSLQSANVAETYANGMMLGPGGTTIPIKTAEDLVLTLPPDLQEMGRAFIMSMPEVHNTDPAQTFNFKQNLLAFTAKAPAPVAYAMEKNMERFTTEAYKQIYARNGETPDEAAAHAAESWAIAMRDGGDADQIPDAYELQEYVSTAAADSTARALSPMPTAAPAAPTQEPATPTGERKAGGILGGLRAAGEGLLKAGANAPSTQAGATAGYLLAGKKGIPDAYVIKQLRKHEERLAKIAKAAPAVQEKMRSGKEYQRLQNDYEDLLKEAKKRGLDYKVKP